ncbi:outer membrane beta-barrel protein [Larkinella sp.]|uniref:outer membrane beta-barrel protein n=1 Tax=Larkinella sp. TaxID=2034517 RepID=UPI003BAD476A
MKFRNRFGVVGLPFPVRETRQLLFVAGISAWLVSLPARAQENTIRGTFRDKNNIGLAGVSVVLVAQRDTTQKQYRLTDTTGGFHFEGLAAQSYLLRATCLGFSRFIKAISIPQPHQDIGILVLQEQVNTLRAVTVVGKLASVVQNSDTVQFNAAAYQVNPDASTEDLVRKLPGISLENGTVKAQGQTVKQILVDGKPFFGDDPAIALRNLPADAVAKVELFDQWSEQSKFSGINDGNTVKTINIVTRADRKKSVFGRGYAGAGTAGTYTAGGNLNFFSGKQRLSLIGLGNTINEQNFSTQDLVGVGSGDAPKPPIPGGGFQVSPQTGISQTHSIGVQFSDEWGRNMTVQGSYFFNHSTNRNQQSDYRQYFLPGSRNLYSRTQTESKTRMDNHRMDIRVEYALDDRNSLVFAPRLSVQSNQPDQTSHAQTLQADSTLLNRTASHYQDRNQGYSLANKLLFRHRFGRPGRTLSLDLGATLSNRQARGEQASQTDYFDDSTTSQTIQQHNLTTLSTRQFVVNAVYTEPLNAVSQLHLSGQQATSYSVSVRDIRSLRPETSPQDWPNVLLSNTLWSNYTTRRIRMGYHLHSAKTSLVVDLAYQHATLFAEQTDPDQSKSRTSFVHFLPAADFRYLPNADTRIQLMYRTTTQAPSATQLQNVIDTTNPLLISTGNPALKPVYNHTFTANYTLTRSRQGSSVFIELIGNLARHYIGSATVFSEGMSQSGSDSLGMQGVQRVRPVNLNGYHTVGSQLTYGLPLQFIKSNLNLNAGYAYSQIPSQIAGHVNFLHGFTFTQGTSLSSNISPKIDFYVAYLLNYNQIRNTLQTRSNSRFVSQTVSARLSWWMGAGFVCQSDMTSQTYRSFSSQQTQHLAVWNAALGKKFLKDRRGELKVSVFDLLRQNARISQVLTDTYFQTSQSKLLQRYFLLTFTYTIRPLKKGNLSEQNLNSQAIPGRPEKP